MINYLNLNQIDLLLKKHCLNFSKYHWFFYFNNYLLLNQLVAATITTIVATVTIVTTVTIVVMEGRLCYGFDLDTKFMDIDIHIADGHEQQFIVVITIVVNLMVTCLYLLKITGVNENMHCYCCIIFQQTHKPNQYCLFVN